AGRRPHRAGGHLPARLPAAAGDAARLHRQAARQDHEHEARQEPRPRDHRAGERPARPGPAAPDLPWGVTAVSGPEENSPASEPDPDENLPARLGEERLAEPVVGTGLFGVQDTPD